MGKLIGEAMQAGWLIATEGCLPSAAGARVRLAAGKFHRDGQTVRGDERIDWRLRYHPGELEARAIEHTKYFLQVAGGGETEIRQLHEAPAAAPANA